MRGRRTTPLASAPASGADHASASGGPGVTPGDPAAGVGDGDEVLHGIVVHLDELLAARGMTLTELSQRTGHTLANLSILKTGKARAVRFTSLTAICRALDCQPGDLLTLEEPPVG